MHTLPRGIRTLSLATLGFAAVAVAACHDDNDVNTAPPVATSIVVNTATNGQTGAVGQPLANPISVHVTDQFGNVISGATVAWAVVGTAGTVSAPTSTTNSTGDATIIWTLGNTAGAQSLTATLANNVSVTINATAQAAAFASITKVSGDAQAIAVSAVSQPLVVKAVDQFGNPVAGATVAWVIAGGGTLSTGTTTTGANGTAQVTVTAGATAGTYTITATSGLAAPITFTVTAS